MVDKHGVVIIGGGIAGLTVALVLARQKIDVAILELNTGTFPSPRATTLKAPSLEIYNDLGIIDILLERGLQCDEFQVRIHETSEYVTLNHESIKEDTLYPFRLHIEQKEVCNVLVEELQRLGVPRYLEHDVTQVENTKSGVSITASHLSQEKLFFAKYVFACDGSKSKIRTMLSAGFSGYSYPMVSVNVSSTIPFDDHLKNLDYTNFIHRREGNYILTKLPNIWYLSYSFSQDAQARIALSNEGIEHHLRSIIPGLGNMPPVQKKAYRSHNMRVKSLLQGNTIFSGDSAQISSTIGEYRYNSAIQDAFISAKMVAEVITGKSTHKKLQEYAGIWGNTLEETVLEQANNQFLVFQSMSLSTQRLELKKLIALKENPEKERRYVRKINMLDSFLAIKSRLGFE